MSDTERFGVDLKQACADSLLEDLQLLSPLNALMPHHLSALAAERQERWLLPGDEVFRLGQYDPWVYYLMCGELICEDAQGQRERVMALDTLIPLDPFQPRTVTAVAQAECQLVAFERSRLDELLTWSQVAEYLITEITNDPHHDEDEAWMQTILCSNLFMKVPPTNMPRLFQYLRAEVVDRGDAIVRQGELGDRCFFIKEGEARVTRREHERDVPRTLAHIGVGRCFGEDALVQETLRNATVTMTTDGVLMVLDKAHFLTLLKEPDVPALDWQTWSATTAERVLVDVRTQREYGAGHLHGAVNMPLRLLSVKRRLLNPASSVGLYCDTGRRSRAAAALLQAAGIPAVILKAGLDGQAEGSLTEQMTQTEYLLRQGDVVSNPQAGAPQSSGTSI